MLGRCALEKRETGEFIGRVGWDEVADDMPFAGVVASTTAHNLRSRAVMRRIGMTRDPADDFDDPSVPEGPLRRRLPFRIARDTPA